MKIAIGSDHAGVDHKEKIKSFLTDKGYEVQDFGAQSHRSVDYPDFVHPTAMAVETGEADLGVVLCGSGNGAAMTANKHQKIRAALVWNEESALLAKEHNNANIISVPARFVDEKIVLRIVDVFLKAEFIGGRHQVRIDKIPVDS